MKIKTFIKNNQLSMSVTKVAVRPGSIMDPEWEANHYQVKITNASNNESFTTFYSMGVGIKGLPKIVDVLNTIALESGDYLNSSSFEDWASALGYSEDSRKAFNIYRECGHMARSMKRLLGKKQTDILINEVERL